jgi:hypothetical protein
MHNEMDDFSDATFLQTLPTHYLSTSCRTPTYSSSVSTELYSPNRNSLELRGGIYRDGWAETAPWSVIVAFPFPTCHIP